MPRRRKRRPLVSEERPGDRLVEELRKKLPKRGGPRSSPVPKGHPPAAPRILDAEDETGPPFIPPMPEILSQPPARPLPAPRAPLPQVGPSEKREAPRGTVTAGGPQHLEESQEVVASPPTIPQVSLPSEGAPTPTTEESSGQLEAPICPLLGSKCLHEWCEWWEVVTQDCQLTALVHCLSHLQGRVEGLRRWLAFRFGEDPSDPSHGTSPRG